jgi:hypothetical protein
LKEEVRSPLTAWEAAEEKRVNDHEAALCEILAQPHAMATSAEIRAHILKIDGLVDRDWQEFSERAAEALGEARPRLCVMRDAAEQRERDAAELAELRRLKAEREEQDRANAAIEAAEVAAQQRAEAERIRAAHAEEEKAAAVERAREEEQRRAAEAIERARKAERERIEQEAAAAAAKKAAEEAAERKRQENKRHRERVHAKISGALLEFLGDADAKLVIDAIAAGTIPHLSINY